MKNILLLFILLIPAFLFAQYPATGNKQRLGYQTTGDGLIWRGVAADTAIKPRTINNAYFQLDTVNRVLRRYIATQGSWQVVGATPDLSGYLEIADTAAMLSNYPTFGDISTALGDYLPIEGGTLTGTGGAGFIGFPSQVVAPGTPASGLNVFASGSAFNWKGTDGHERQFASTLTGGRTYTLPDVSGTFALGTGTTDRSARWSATNTLAAGNFTDNGTKVQALLPFQFQTYTTAGLPTGVTGYHVYNTTTNGPGWYQGSRWAYTPEFTFNRGTAGRIPYPDANGQYTESANFTYSSSRLRVTSGSDYIDLNPSNGSGRPEIQLFNSGAANILLNADVVGSTGTLFLTGALNISSTLTIGSTLRAPGLQAGTPATFNVQNGSVVIATPAGSLPFINFTESGVGFKSNFGMTTGNPGDLFYETNPTNSNTPGTGTQRFRVNGSTGRFGIGTGSTINYSLEQLSQTDAFGVARGTVAQRPTIVTNTTPFRFNTDSTALEYGESVGTWRQIATRAYARSLVSGLPTINIYTASDSIRGDRYLEMANDGSATFGVGYMPSFPNIWGGSVSGNYGFYISPDYWNGLGVFHEGNTYRSQLFIYDSDASVSVSIPGTGITNSAGASNQGAFLIGDGVIATQKKIQVDSTGFRYFYDASSYSVLPSESSPSTTSTAKTVLQWTGDGSSANPAFIEVKRDTTIYIDDADYDFSAALTTAQIAARYNRVIFWMTTTGAAGSDSEITLHTPDVNLIQVEYLIHSVDEAGGFSNVIRFGTNNAVDSTNGLVSSYFPAAGDGVHIRAGLRSGVYKYRYSN